jgi:hypothetical protein
MKQARGKEGIKTSTQTRRKSKTYRVDNNKNSMYSITLSLCGEKLATCIYRYFSFTLNIFAYALEQFKLHTSRKGIYHFAVLFPIQVYLDSKFCLPLLETAGRRGFAPCTTNSCLLNI